MASADWMPRNLNRRVEIMFPIEQPDLKEKTAHILQCLLKDTLKAQILQPDGSYEKVDRRGKEPFGAQKNFCKEAIAATKAMEEDILEERVFIPEKHHD